MMLRSFLPKSIKYNWIFGIVLILIFTIARFYIVLDANVSKNYGNASYLFTIMALLPFILLNKEGRQFAGIKKPSSYLWLLNSFVIGALVCSGIYLLFNVIYDHSINHSMVYISNSYAMEHMNEDNKFTIFIIFSVTSMIFSPLGEELFYRSLIHGSFVEKFGENKASIFDSLAFALAHLSHFGIIYYMGKWSFLPIPALLWFASMFFLCRMIFICRQKSGSILGPIACHAGFNVAMIYWIFYHIL